TILGTALGVALGNYLPTRLWPAALLLGAWCAFDLARLSEAVTGEWPFAWLALAAAPWLGLVLARRRGVEEVDRVWLGFRDRYGFAGAQPLRDPFTRAAANAGWPVFLGWGGLRRGGPGVDQENVLALLRSALRRFES